MLCCCHSQVQSHRLVSSKLTFASMQSRPVEGRQQAARRERALGRSRQAAPPLRQARRWRRCSGWPPGSAQCACPEGIGQSDSRTARAFRCHGRPLGAHVALQRACLTAATACTRAASMRTHQLQKASAAFRDQRGAQPHDLSKAVIAPCFPVLFGSRSYARYNRQLPEGTRSS